jgi:hypothetical protein
MMFATACYLNFISLLFAAQAFQAYSESVETAMRLTLPITPPTAPVPMRFSGFALCALVFASVALLFAAASAQETPKPSPLLASHARLMAARTIYIEHAGGRIPNDIIGDAFQGWGHYSIVGDPSRADLIVSINAPTSDSGVSVGSSGGRRGSPPPSDSRALSSSAVIQIRLFILDAHDRVTLWSGIQQPKSAHKEKQREDNEVDASLILFRRFRAVIEPEPAPAPPAPTP